MIRKFFASERRQFLSFALLFSLILTLLVTFPWVLEWPSAVPGEPTADAYNYAWSNWWFEKAVFELEQSPADMDRIYYPIGAYHPKEIASIWTKLLSVPAIHFLGADPFLIYNLTMFTAIVLTQFFMIWLCFEVTGSRAGALIGGLIFAFSANRINQALTGHLTQSMTYFYPLLVLAMVRMWRDPRLIRGLLFGLILALAILVDLLPVAFFVGPITVTLLLFLLLSDRRQFFSRAFLGALLPGLALAVLIVIPFYYPMISSAMNGDLGWYAGSGVVQFSADALAFVVPTPEHPLARLWPGLRTYSEEIYAFGLSRFEGTVYLGWLTIILALIGVIKYWEEKADVKYWLTVTFVTVILALGPWLRVGGKLVSVNSQPLLMPYTALLYLPFMSWGRTPARLGLTAVFALALLAAYGVKWLLTQVKHRRAKVALLSAIAALIVLDSLAVFPWPMNEYDVPDFYETLAADERSVAVLDLPVVGYVPAKYYMLYQMEHGHAIVGGWRDRRSLEVEKKMAEFEALARPGGNVAALAQEGIGYIVLHKQFLESGDLKRLKGHLDREIEGVAYENSHIVVFRLDDVDEIAPPPIPVGRP